ncbi:MAG: response regulator transcription factor [Hyphomonadaceae bacterium]|nr:response regulator transcription factor [Hyphomonadaceae bacterium]
MLGVAPEILVVEDDSELRQEVVAYLREHCFVVREAGDAATMDRSLKERSVDLVILDLGLPGEGGLSVCRRLAEHGRGPGILIASAQGEETDRVVGLELGADDYLAKPYSPRELLARVKAVLRRTAHVRATAPAARYQAAGLVFDPEQRLLSNEAGEAALLTQAESAILDAMLSNAGRVVAREELAPAGCHGVGRAIDLRVSRLRRKLARLGAPDLIQTHRGLGYLVDRPVPVQ